MFRRLLILSIIAAANVCYVSVPQSVVAQDEANTNQELIQKASLMIGYNIARNMKSQGMEVDQAKFLEGIQKGLTGAELEVSDEEFEATMTAFQKYMQKRQIEKMKIAAEANKVEGEAFLAKNGAREGVKKLENGVQYEVMNTGTGATPAPEDTVRIHYHGTLPTGEIFDSSVKRNEPAELQVNRFVPGFAATLQAMKVGDKWRIVIPSELAYGMQGDGMIGPNRTLVFELELLEIVK